MLLVLHILAVLPDYQSGCVIRMSLFEKPFLWHLCVLQIFFPVSTMCCAAALTKSSLLSLL